MSENAQAPAGYIFLVDLAPQFKMKPAQFLRSVKEGKINIPCFRQYPSQKAPLMATEKAVSQYLKNRARDAV